jgi:hypothetical protein
VRISGLPIEFYDAKVLRFIGDRIGRTVKVDKNTLTQERGKYARLCVEVDLTKPLLAMSTIKEKKYHVAYEGLHLLCVTCGKFGHYTEGCPDKVKIPAAGSGGGHTRQGGSGGHGATSSVGVGNNGEGPWVVVQKPRRSRKVKENLVTGEKGQQSTENLNGDPKISGSRFASLRDDTEAINDHITDDIERGISQEGKETNREANKEGNRKLPFMQIIKNKKGSNGGTMERGVHDNKLATRGSVNFKSKSGGAAAKKVASGESNVRERGVPHMGEVHVSGPNGKEIEGCGGKNESNYVAAEENIGGTNNNGSQLGQHIVQPNIPRPPNWLSTTSINRQSVLQNEKIHMVDNEEFVDAIETGSLGSVDSDMETVGETPNLTQ